MSLDGKNPVTNMQGGVTKSVEKKYRHEYKYLCDRTQNAILKMRAQGLLQKDVHAGESGYYHIRSLYFDTLEHQCYQENENGNEH